MSNLTVTFTCCPPLLWSETAINREKEMYRAGLYPSMQLMISYVCFTFKHEHVSIYTFHGKVWKKVGVNVQATSQLMYGRCEICRTYILLNGNDKSIVCFIGYGIAHSNNYAKQIY